MVDLLLVTLIFGVPPYPVDQVLEDPVIVGTSFVEGAVPPLRALDCRPVATDNDTLNSHC